MTRVPPPPRNQIVVLHAPEDRVHSEALRKHLRILAGADAAEVWDKSDLGGGDDAAEMTNRRVAAASLLILLVSADHFPGHDDELDRHVATALTRKIRIVPVQVRDCLWEMSTLRHLEILPRERGPVSLQQQQEAVWVEVVREVRRLLTAPAAKASPSALPETDSALATADSPPVAAPPELPPPPAIKADLRAAADSPTVPVRVAALQRIAELKEDLTPEDVAFLVARLEAMPREALLSIVWRHGTLGNTESIVQRLVADMPGHVQSQLNYLGTIGVTTLGLSRELHEVLGEDAYADFVARVRPRVAPFVLMLLLVKVQGCALFNAITARGGNISSTTEGKPQEGLTASLLEVRNDEDGCRRLLCKQIAEADTRGLLRLEAILSKVACSDLAADAGQRLRDRFGVVFDRNDRGRDCILDDHVRFVTGWVTAEGAERPERIRWLADRLWDLDRQGFSFYRTNEQQDPLRLALARDLAARGKAVSWGGDVVQEHLAAGTLDAWRLAFAWRERWKGSWPFEHRDLRKWMLAEAPLPPKVGDDFDARFLESVREDMAFEASQVQHTREQLIKRVPGTAWGTMTLEEMAEPQYALLLQEIDTFNPFNRLRPVLSLNRTVPRLLDAALTPSRATWLARLAKEAPKLFAHAKIGELADLAEPMTPDELPPIARLDLDEGKQIAAYRILAGPTGDDRLRAHIRALVSPDPSPADAVDSLCEAWPWIQSILNDAFLAELRGWLRDAPVFLLGNVHRHSPWLVDKHMLHEEARKQLDVAGWQREIHHLPRNLLPLVLERARRASAVHELETLLSWLDEKGIPRAQRFELLMTDRPMSHHRWATAVASMAASVAEWNELGPRILDWLLKGRRWFLMHELWTRQLTAFSEAHGLELTGEGLETARRAYGALLAAVHGTFTAALLDAAEAAAQRHEEPRLLAALDALLHLVAGTDTRERLSRISTMPDLSDAARTRIADVRSLLEHAPAAPSQQSLLAATEAAAAPDMAEWSPLLRATKPPADGHEEAGMEDQAARILVEGWS